MYSVSHKWFACLLLAALVGIGGSLLATPATAADADTQAAADSAVQPYTGPPVYLDEPETIVPPALVEHQKITDKYPGGEVRYERQIARFSDNHFEADGFYREYYRNGQLFAEGQYRRGRQNGEWTYYHENGQLDRKVTFEAGLPEGQVDVYRDDGTLSAKRSFANGKRSGEWTVYDDTGEMKLREEHYRDGKPDGQWQSWYPSGQLERQVPFKDGDRHGVANEWNEDGSPRAEVSYNNGKLDGVSKVWLSDGRTIVRTYDQSQLVSESIE